MADGTRTLSWIEIAWFLYEMTAIADVTNSAKHTDTRMHICSAEMTLTFYQMSNKLMRVCVSQHTTHTNNNKIVLTCLPKYCAGRTLAHKMWRFIGNVFFCSAINFMAIRIIFVIDVQSNRAVVANELKWLVSVALRCLIMTFFKSKPIDFAVLSNFFIWKIIKYSIWHTVERWNPSTSIHFGSA